MGYTNKVTISWKETERGGWSEYACRACGEVVELRTWCNSEDIQRTIDLIDNNCGCCEACYGNPYRTKGHDWSDV